MSMANVLVIEDERPLLSVIKKKLENAGYDVVTSRSVDQAISYLHDGVHIDLIWLDHYLFGNKDGLDFLNEIKKPGSDWSTIPILVVTNTATMDKKHSYINFGVEKYYAKVDFRLDEIINDVNKLLKGK